VGLVEIKEVAFLLLMKHHSLMTPEVVLLAHSDFLMNNHNNFWSNFSLLVWNVQGAGSEVFLNTLKEMIRRYDPKVLVLVETKISCFKADLICKKNSS